jgi:methylmalonyl-CoA/ethylmalonyl-CoA epimerase
MTITRRNHFMITKIDHLGIAVPSLEQAVPYYEKALGLKCEHREEVASQKVRTAFFTVGDVHLELLEPTSPDSPIAKFLEKNPAGGIHHVAFGTSDVDGQLRQAAGTGVRLINEKAFDGAGGKLVAFLHPKSTFGVLTEFCMPNPAATH